MARAAAERLVADDPAAAERILDVIEEALARQLASLPPLARQDRAALERESAAARLLRVSSRRRRGDFIGAALLLAAGFSELPPPARRGLPVERALVAAELSDPAALHLPTSEEERASLARRLVPAGSHIEAALAVDPEDAVAHLLAGALARCQGDHVAAVAHLDRALAGFPPGRLPADQHATVLLHRWLAAARVETEDADTTVAAIVSALDAGARSSAELLLDACDALDARGSSATGELRRRASAFDVRGRRGRRER